MTWRGGVNFQRAVFHSSSPGLPPSLKLRRAGTAEPRRSLGVDGTRRSSIPETYVIEPRSAFAGDDAENVARIRVIASHPAERKAPPDDRLREAIHRAAQKEMDCFVASAPRNDVERDAVLHSRGVMRPRLCIIVVPRRKRGSRECRVRAAPAVSCARCTKKNAHEHTGSAEHPAFPAQWFYGLCRALPGDEFVLSPSLRIMADRARLGRFRLRQLDTSNGCQDHTVLPYATAPFVCAPLLAHGKPALRSPCAPTLPRPPHPIPRS